ncbi:MAG: tRNA-dihydrouridine synthase [bacterium]
MSNFWIDLPKPIFSAAPMEDVTDTVFREILLRRSDIRTLNVVCTEFVATDGICHEVGVENVSHRFVVSDSERELLKSRNTKIIAQIWGAKPENFYRSIKFITETYQFDGIDINMGCPVKKIVRQSGGAFLTREPELAKEIIEASKSATSLPISVKTRTGDIEPQIEIWIKALAEAKPDAITLHGRTRSMMYKGLADWNDIKKAKELVKSISPETVFIGNGDIHSLSEANEQIAFSGVDGVMVGRAMMSNPWIFSTNAHNVSVEMRLHVLLEHAGLFDEVWGKSKPFAVLKKFFKAYINSFNGASELRQKLMTCSNLEDLENLIAYYSL